MAKQPSLSELREKYLAEGANVPSTVIATLEADGRAGAQSLLRAIKTRQAENRSEGQRLRHMLKFENELWAQGYKLIAGVDEAGAGPCAGPIMAGAAILPLGYKLRGLDDSKKILDEAKRDELAEAVKRDAVAWAVGVCTHEEIDEINVLQAGLLAMKRAVEGLAVKPDYLLVDARRVPGVPQPQQGIIKGDAQSLSIAAGAILAKTTRDRHMNELAKKHPEYGFEHHKGYPAPAHLAAIARHGVLWFHRKSYAPIRRALGLEPEQQDLFAVSTPQQNRR